MVIPDLAGYQKRDIHRGPLLRKILNGIIHRLLSNLIIWLASFRT